MPLLPEPIFYQTIKREDGAKRKLIYIQNSEEDDLSLDVTDVEKPEWVEIEELYPGAKIDFPCGKRTSVIVNLNTNHRFFPHGQSMDEFVKVTFSNEDVIEIPITIHQITEGIEDFRGVFAMDFGTTNTCYAYKGKLDEYQDAYTAQETHTSAEIPTLIFFKDVSSSTNPKYLVGNSAKQEIQEFGWQTYSYFMSIKRDLGQDEVKGMRPVMDEHAAEGEGHRQQWHVEDISSFLARDIITRAQQDIGQRITRVVATYPTLFTMHQKESLTRVFEKAFQDLGVEVDENTVILDLDETNAAAFNYIYGTMLNEMRGLAIREKKATLLSYDFGGGTIDVSLIDILISRDDVGRINIKTDVKGLTGERYYGGDNVTLEVMKILKKKAAKTVAEKLMAGVIADREAAEAAKEKEDDVFSMFGGGSSDDEDEDDMFGGGDDEDEEEEADKGPVVEEDPELAEIENCDDENEYKTAAELVQKHIPVIDRAIEQGKSITQAFLEWEEDQGTLVAKDQSQRKAEQLERAIERLVPTQYKAYENVDPRKFEVARRLFLEIWQEADILKIRLSNSQIGTERVASEFKRIAKYSGVDKIAFTEIEVTIEELEAAIGPRVRQSVEKAYNLYKSTLVHSVGGNGGDSGGSGLEIVSDSGSGLMIDDGSGGGSADEKELRILLAGNGCRLPMIKRTVMEVFQVDDSRIIMDKGQIKTGTARGASEEYYLRMAFGKSGIITYEPSGFLDKIPYTIGLYNRDLEFVGFEKGFCPIFNRETKVGTKIVLNGRNNPLIFEGMQQLTVFADYHDQAPPYYMGYFDFTKPMDESEHPDAPSGEPGTESTDEGAPAEEGADVGGLEVTSGDDAPKEEAPASEGKHHKIEVTLMPTRLPEAFDPKTGKYFKFFPRKDVWKDDENPFSGAH